MRLIAFLLIALLAAPAYAQKPPSLVDRLMELLGDKSVLPPIEVKPTVPMSALTTPKRSPGGLEIASHFLPIYDLNSANAEGETPKPYGALPFFASADIGRPQRNVFSLIILVPDSDREAARAYAFVRAAQDKASAAKPDWYPSNALVFVPQFLNPEDLGSQKSNPPALSWPGGGWIYGADSVAPQPEGVAFAPKGMSAFEVMDFVLLALARKQAFPDLERVVIAGAGGGGDFVQRYAALGLAPDIVTGDGINVRFVTANAWSYLYFDKNRAVPPEAGVAGADSSDPVFSEPKADVCASYNRFPYGLDILPPYGKRQGETALRLRYDSRNVIYLAGKSATQALPDSSPQACALVMQGRSLHARAQTYFQHLNRLYGDTLPRTQRFYAVDKISTEAGAMWGSACGMSSLFGDGACEGGANPSKIPSQP